MIRAFFLLALLAGPLAARADDAPGAPVTDPAVVRAHYDQILTRPEFRETDETLADFRWGDWLSDWMKHLVSRFQDFQYAGQFSTAARALVVVMTVVALGGLAFLLVRLSRRRRERTGAQAEAAPAGQKLLSLRQYESRLRRALERQDWHAAWLVAWLQLLARLEHRQLVAADRSRTNREYLAQLRAQRLPDEAFPLLARMVDDYDRVIYGVRPVDEAGWTAFRERIDEVTLMLGLRERAAEEPA